jgi:hypothetical protein
MQFFQNVETAVVTEGFLIMMTILGYFLLNGTSAPPLWILRQYQTKLT